MQRGEPWCKAQSWWVRFGGNLSTDILREEADPSSLRGPCPNRDGARGLSSYLFPSATPANDLTPSTPLRIYGEGKVEQAGKG
jgi:hypothetical protein